MAVEIERKYLVRDIPVSIPVTREGDITQGYLSVHKDRTVRVRVVEGSETEADYAAITIKGKTTDDGLSRDEFEYFIPVDEAKQMLTMCMNVIKKTRYTTPAFVKTVEGKTQPAFWEVDVFHGDNEGLIVAEIELRNVGDMPFIPDWIGQEVTGQVRYYNSSLSAVPYKNWA